MPKQFPTFSDALSLSAALFLLAEMHSVRRELDEIEVEIENGSLLAIGAGFVRAVHFRLLSKELDRVLAHA